MPHSYRVSLEPHDGRSSLEFDVTNHDDILPLVERVRASGLLPEHEAAAFMLGLKLFGEVMLHHRGDPLFVDLYPHFGPFMKRLKAAVAGSAQA